MRDFALIIHFIGLAMGMGTAFAFMFLNIRASSMEDKEKLAFLSKVKVLSKMGHTGYAILILSGLLLMSPYWPSLLEETLLTAKLVLVVMLGAFIGMASASMRKAVDRSETKYLDRLVTIGPIGLLTGISIVILSVLIFH